jgi:quinol monooxygenase YgiN
MHLKQHISAKTIVILGVVATVVAGMAGTAVAQEDPQVPYPFFYLIKAKVDATKVNAYQEALAKVVEAHKQHDNGNNWAGFSQLFGGPEAIFYFFLPTQKLGEIDDWLPNTKVVADIHGEAAAEKIFRTLGESSKSMSKILAYAPGISNPDPAWTGAVPQFVYHIRAQAEPGKVSDYAALVQKLVAAHKDHPSGLHWVGYSVLAGGEAGEFHFFVGMQKLGEMDAWPMGPELIEEKYGEEEAGKLLGALPQVSKAQDELLAHVPESSNPAPTP